MSHMVREGQDTQRHSLWCVLPSQIKTTPHPLEYQEVLALIHDCYLIFSIFPVIQELKHST